jgi:hypothetical protein
MDAEARQVLHQLLDQQGFSRELPTDQSGLAIFDWTCQVPTAEAVTGHMGLFEVDHRPSLVSEAFGSLKSFDILELGSFEGAHTYQLEKKFGARSVTSIEASAQSYLKSVLVKNLLNLNARILYGDVIRYMEENKKKYDLIFASGILYHMTDPLKLLSLISQRTNRVYIWSLYVSDSIAKIAPIIYESSCGGYSCDYYKCYYPTGPGREYSGTESFCCRLKQDDILNALRHYGLSDIRILEQGLAAPDVPSITFVAERPPAKSAPPDPLS